MADTDFSRLLAKWKTLYAIFADDSVTPSGKHVAAVLMDDHRRLGCFPGYERLLKLTGYSRRGLQKAINSLERAGWVVVQRPNNGRQSNRYAPAYARGERAYARLKQTVNEAPADEVGMPADEADEGGRTHVPEGANASSPGGERTFPEGANTRSPESSPESPQIESSPPVPAREEEDRQEVEVYGPEWDQLINRVASIGTYEGRHGREGSGLAREDVDQFCRALGQKQAWQRLNRMLESGMFGAVLEDRIREGANCQPRPKGPLAGIMAAARERHPNPLRAAGEQQGACPFEQMGDTGPADAPDRIGLEDVQALGRMGVNPPRNYLDRWLATKVVNNDPHKLRRMINQAAKEAGSGDRLVAYMDHATGLRAASPEQDLNKLAAG